METEDIPISFEDPRPPGASSLSYLLYEPMAEQRLRLLLRPSDKNSYPDDLLSPPPTHTEVQEDEAGKSVGTKIIYFPKRVLGTGSMGAKVYIGKYEDVRNVAVKRIDEEFYEVVENEIKLLSASDLHQNIVRYICNEVNDEFCFIALELCHANLVDWVRQNDKGKCIGGYLENQTLKLQILHHCTLGLNYIHSKNIVHRDLKPTNILLRREGSSVIAKITDFGLGKKIIDWHMSYTNSGKDTGTQGWKAPEVINLKQGGRMTAKVDVFALGLIFYYVLKNGKHPFGDLSDQTECQHNIRKGNFLSPIRIPNDFRGITQLIERMLSFEPKNRPCIATLVNHPMFWMEYKIAKFFIEINSMYFDRRVLVQDVLDKLEVGKDNVFLDNWIFYLPIEVQKALKLGNTNYNGSRFRDLVRAIRNTWMHYEEFPFELKTEIGTRTDLIRCWFKTFHSLLLYTWEGLEPVKNEGGFQYGNFYNGNCDFLQTSIEN